MDDAATRLEDEQSRFRKSRDGVLQDAAERICREDHDRVPVASEGALCDWKRAVMVAIKSSGRRGDFLDGVGRLVSLLSHSVRPLRRAWLSYGSWSQWAKCLGKSTRSLARYLEWLLDEGYLVVVERGKSEGNRWDGRGPTTATYALVGGVSPEKIVHSVTGNPIKDSKETQYPKTARARERWHTRRAPTSKRQRAELIQRLQELDWFFGEIPHQILKRVLHPWLTAGATVHLLRDMSTKRPDGTAFAPLIRGHGGQRSYKSAVGVLMWRLGHWMTPAGTQAFSERVVVEGVAWEGWVVARGRCVGTRW